MKLNYSKLLPHFIVLAIFWLITAMYFQPLVFDEYALPQHDIQQWKAGAKELIDYRDNHDGEESMWTNSMFGGMPAYLVSTKYPNNLTSGLQKVLYLGLPYPVALILLAMISAYVMFFSFGIKNPWLAAVGSIGFGLASFMCISIGAGHNAKVVAIALAPMVIGGVNLIFERKYLIGFVLTALSIALEIGAGHIQITYYLFLLLLIYGVSALICQMTDIKFLTLTKISFKFKDPKSFGISIGVLLIAVLLGVSTNASRLMTIVEYGKYSTRGQSEISAELLMTEAEKKEAEKSEIEDKSDGLPSDYAFKWSQGAWENFTFLVPHLFGGGSYGSLDTKSETYNLLVEDFRLPETAAENFVKQVPLYSGEQPGTAGPIYMGAIICFLFVLGLFVLEDRYRWWLLVGFILSLFLSMGKNFPEFNELMFNHFPGYNKFRTVSMTVVIAQFVMPLMGVLALNKLIESEKTEDLMKKFLYALGTVGGLLLLIILFGGSFNYTSQYDPGFRQMLAKQIPAAQLQQLINTLMEDRASLAKTDALRSLIFILLAGAAIYLMMMKKVSKEIGIGVIALLMLVDLWGINKIYLNESKYVESEEQQMVDAQLFPLSPASKEILKDKSHYRVYDLNNPFNNANTSFYHQSVGGYHGAKMRRYQDLITMYISKNDQKVLEMLNVKYVIQSPQKSIPLPNIGNAWFVKDVKTVEGANNEILFLGKEEFNPKNNAVVDAEKFKPSKASYGQSGTIKLVEYESNRLKYTSDNTEDGFAVFSEIYYPTGWKVTIDGKETNHMRANYVLRGMEIPKGKHTIEFSFEPSSYYVGETISLIGSILIFASFGVVGFLFYKEQKEKVTE